MRQTGSQPIYAHKREIVIFFYINLDEIHTLMAVNEMAEKENLVEMVVGRAVCTGST